MKAVASSSSVHFLCVKHSSKEIVISNSSIHKSVSRHRDCMNMNSSFSVEFGLRLRETKLKYFYT